MELRDFNLSQKEDPMTEPSLPLVELLAKAGDPDFLRNAAEAVVQILMEADVEGLIGAARHERTSGPPIATAFATATSIPASARCNCGYRSCVRAVTSRRPWNRAKPPRKPLSR